MIHIEKYIKDIQEAQRKGRLVLFVGAGVSANSGVPTWGSLINALKDDLSLINGPISETDDLKIAQLYKCQFGKKDYIEKIKQTLKYNEVPTNEIHRVIMDMEPAHIITTNYDNLLEKAIQERFVHYDVIKQDKDIPYEQYPHTLIKMHGDFDSDNIVLCEEDYFNYSRKFPLIKAVVKSLFASNLVLFVGFSFNDINLKYILRELQDILAEDMPRIYFLTDQEQKPMYDQYYTHKHVQVINFSQEQITEIEKEYGVSFERTNVNSIENSRGQLLYKQLYLINYFKPCKDVFRYIVSRANTYKNEILNYGYGIKYLVPFPYSGFFFTHRGIQSFNENVKRIESKYKSEEGKKQFIEDYSDIVESLKSIIRANNIQHFNNFEFDLSDGKANPTCIDMLYHLDMEALQNRMQLLRAQDYKDNSDALELPFILYKLGRIQESYILFKKLSEKMWQNKRYVLFYICLYNLKQFVGLLFTSNENLLNPQEEEKQLSHIYLRDILSDLPIEGFIKNLLWDITTGKYQADLLNDATKQEDNIHEERVNVERGGFSANSHISSINGLFVNTLLFYETNHIIGDNNKYLISFIREVIKGVLNSHATLDASNPLFQSTKQGKIQKSHLLLMLYWIDDNKILKNIFKYDDIKKITLSDDALAYLVEWIIPGCEKISNNGACYLDHNLFITLLENLITVVSHVDNVIPQQIYEAVKMLLRMGFIDWNEMSRLINNIIPSPKYALDILQIIIKDENNQMSPQAGILFKLSKIAKTENFELRVNDIESRLCTCKMEEILKWGELYHLLPQAQKQSFISIIEKEPIDIYTLTMLVGEYDIPVLSKRLLEKVLPPTGYNKHPAGEEVSCQLIAKIANDPKWENLLPLITKYFGNNTCYQFFLSPVEFCHHSNPNPEWVICCENEILIQLLDIRRIRESVLQYVFSQEGGYEKQNVLEILIGRRNSSPIQ